MGRPRKVIDVDAPAAPRPKKRAPARTLEARENQLISLGMDLAEQQIRDGTVTSQVLTEIIRRGSTKSRLEKEILDKQKELLDAKTDAMKSQKTVEELYTKALDAMRMYSGSDVEEDYEH